MTRQAHVLLVAYGGGHVTMVVPVLRELERRGVRCTLMALTTGHAKARALGLAPLGYRDFLDLLDEPERTLELGRSLASENSHPEVDPDETLVYMGVNYAEWVDAYGRDEAARLYRDQGRHGFLPRRFMEKVLRHLDVDAVVTTNSPRTEQAAIEAAVAIGIPVLSMIDLFALPHDAYLRRPVHADRIAVINQAARRNLMAAGVDADRILVTGNPAFDSLADPAVHAAGQALRSRLGWNGRNVVFLAPQVELQPGTPREWFGPGLGSQAEGLLRDWVAAGNDRALFVRHHPSEAHLFPDLGDQPFVYRSNPIDEPLHPIIFASNVAVVQTSTVGLEAVLAGLPLVSLGYSPVVRPDMWDYGHFGLARSVWNPCELTSVLERALAEPNLVSRDEFNVGNATTNVAASVMSLLEAKRKDER